jgi:hypothetical protein
MTLPTDITATLIWLALALIAVGLLGFAIGRASATQKLIDAQVMIDVCARYMPDIIEAVYGATVRTPRKPRLRPWLTAAIKRAKAALAPAPEPAAATVKTVPAGERKPAPVDTPAVARTRFPNLHKHMSRERLLTAPPIGPQLPRWHDRILMLDLTGSRPRGHFIPA